MQSRFFDSSTVLRDNYIMKKKTFFITVGIVFLIVALVHLKRSVFGWDFIIKNWEVPLWVSWIAVVGIGFLSYHAFKFWKK